VVLVVRRAVGEGHLKDLADDSANEDGFLLAVGRGVPEVRKQFLVEQGVDPLLAVLTLLSCGEFLLKPFVGLRRVLGGVFLRCR
jgi:hypothetical protein